jgi:hypothetical protein
MPFSIKVNELHPMQTYILENSRRFTAILGGRRFGKTDIIGDIFLEFFNGKRIGFFAQIFKDVAETWNTFERKCETINKQIGGKTPYFKIDKQLKTIHQIIEGVDTNECPCIEFWGLENEGAKDKGRGRKYNIVIYEETQKITSDVLKHHWEQVARATLLDYSGDAYFFGTAPNSHRHYFYELICRGSLNNPDLLSCTDIVPTAEIKQDSDFYSMRVTSYDNPHVNPHEIDKIRQELPEMIFLQEYLAECVEFANNLWCFTLSKKTTQQKLFKPTSFFPSYKFYTQQGAKMVIKFDFNKNPMAATVTFQDSSLRYIHTRKEFGAPEGQQVLLTYTIALIKEWIAKIFGVKIGRWDNTHYECPDWLNLFVTGDAFGAVTDGRQPRSDYEIIKKELGLQIKHFVLKSHNPRHVDSHSHINTYIEKHPNYHVDEIECPHLRTDMLNAKANEDKGIDKKSYDPHFLDTERYYFENFTNPDIALIKFD